MEVGFSCSESRAKRDDHARAAASCALLLFSDRPRSGQLGLLVGFREIVEDSIDDGSSAISLKMVTVAGG